VRAPAVSGPDDSATAPDSPAGSVESARAILARRSSSRERCSACGVYLTSAEASQLLPPNRQVSAWQASTTEERSGPRYTNALPISDRSFAGRTSD
jgi:hypothetical protein